VSRCSWGYSAADASKPATPPSARADFSLRARLLGDDIERALRALELQMLQSAAAIRAVADALAINGFTALAADLRREADALTQERR
jgi:hypothetical protein